MFAECVCHMGWRTYSSGARRDVSELIDRFLTNHARVPGGLSEHLFGVVPIAVFRFTDDADRRFEGAVFLNGAVVRISRGDHEAHFLFVDEKTAETWGYPEGFSTYSTQT